MENVRVFILLVIISSCFVFSNINTAYAFWDFGGWEKKYNLLFGENEELKNDVKRLELEMSKILELNKKQLDKIDILTDKIFNLEENSRHWEDQTYEYYEKLKDSNDKYNSKIRDYSELVDDYNIMNKGHDKQIDVLNNEIFNLEENSRHWEDQTYEYYDKYNSKIRDYSELVGEYNLIYDEASKPRLEIEKTKIKWTIKDSKGKNYGINWHVKQYEDLKVYSDKKSLTQKPVYLNLDGQKITSIGLDGFVNGGTFGCCIDDIYDNSNSNSDFIFEVWYIVSQMTIYDLDVNRESEGRFALETLVRGGGDCEDLVILIAEMLKSSSHTKDWDIQYVYMDSENHLDPQTVNHVILYVNDGTYNYYIEATGKPDLNYYPDGIVGWYFDV